MAENKSKVLIVIKRVLQVVFAAVPAALTILTVYIMVCSIHGKAAVVFGTSILKVVTGSMEPSIHAGDYIIIKEIDRSELEEGDIICFYSSDSAIYGMLNTHRIVRRLEDGSFVTKGDANQAEDPVTVTADAIIGKYEGKVRALRWINSFASVKKLIYLAVVAVMTAVAIYEVITIAKVSAEYKVQKERRQAAVRQAIDEEKQKLYEQGYAPDDRSKDEKSG